MEEQILKRIITKLKANEFLPTLSRWSFLSSQDLATLKSRWSTKQTKRVISNNIADFCMNKGGLKMGTVGDLDLIYTQMHPMKKTWNAYRLIERQGSALESQKKLVPDTVKKDLNKLLRLYFRARDTTASLMLHNGLLWGRVYLPLPCHKSYQPSRCLYFVYYPQTPIILMSGTKSESTFGVFLSKCLLFVLGCKDSEELNLTGHDLESLAELAINKFSSGGYNRFQLTHRPGGPVGEVRSRKRKVPEIDEHERITCEYMAEKRRRMEVLDDTFGTTVLPTLEKVEYRVELPYRGQIISPELQKQEDILHSRVKFQGKSVLEGIRNLAAAGYATMPLQKHLTCIPSRARNHFMLARKTSTGNETQQKEHVENSQSTNQRVPERTANLHSPQRVANRTAHILSPQRAGNRTVNKPLEKKQAQKTLEKNKEGKRLGEKKIIRKIQLINKPVSRNSPVKLSVKRTGNGKKREQNSNVQLNTSKTNNMRKRLKPKKR